MLDCKIKLNVNKVSQKRHFVSKNAVENYLLFTTIQKGARGGVVVKALRYKPTGRGFYCRWCHWNFSVS
jgi:hypothetical protein